MRTIQAHNEYGKLIYSFRIKADKAEARARFLARKNPSFTVTII